MLCSFRPGACGPQVEIVLGARTWRAYTVQMRTDHAFDRRVIAYGLRQLSHHMRQHLGLVALPGSVMRKQTRDSRDFRSGAMQLPGKGALVMPSRTSDPPLASCLLPDLKGIGRTPSSWALRRVMGRWCSRGGALLHISPHPPAGRRLVRRVSDIPAPRRESASPPVLWRYIPAFRKLVLIEMPNGHIRAPSARDGAS
jgi:hypothetical protein